MRPSQRVRTSVGKTNRPPSSFDTPSPLSEDPFDATRCPSPNPFDVRRASPSLSATSKSTTPPPPLIDPSSRLSLRGLSLSPCASRWPKGALEADEDPRSAALAVPRSQTALGLMATPPKSGGEGGSMFTPLTTRDCDGGEGSESPETKAAVDSFLKAFHQKDLLKYSQLKMAFRDLDTEKKGALDYDDMKKAVQRMGLSVSDDVLAAVVRRVDADGNGSIDFNEFATYLWPNMTVDLILDDRKRDKRSKVLNNGPELMQRQRYLWFSQDRVLQVDTKNSKVGVFNDEREAYLKSIGQLPQLHPFALSKLPYNVISQAIKTSPGETATSFSSLSGSRRLDPYMFEYCGSVSGNIKKRIANTPAIDRTYNIIQHRQETVETDVVLLREGSAALQRSQELKKLQERVALYHTGISRFLACETKFATKGDMANFYF